MNWRSTWSGAEEAGADCPGTEFGAPSKVRLDGSYVFMVCVIAGGDIIVVYFAKGEMGRNRDKAADKPVVVMGAKV